VSFIPISSISFPFNEKEQLLRSEDKNVPYGSDEWIDKVTTKYGITQVLRGVGRPKNGGWPHLSRRLYHRVMSRVRGFSLILKGFKRDRCGTFPIYSASAHHFDTVPGDTPYRLAAVRTPLWRAKAAQSLRTFGWFLWLMYTMDSSVLITAGVSKVLNHYAEKIDSW